MKSRFSPIFLILLVLFLPVASADFNPKSISDIEVTITKSGTIDVTGNIKVLNLSLYIPQEGVSSIEASADWNYIEDDFGNKLIVLKWLNPRGTISYKVDVTVENSAKYMRKRKPIGENYFYLRETDSIVFDDTIRKFAYPYERTVDRAAELSMAVHDIMEYDESLAGKEKSSTWVLENRRGVCVEYDNLLTALLRVSGIPARYVVGYAYSTLDKKFLGHSWVEILTEEIDAQGASSTFWVPFDPTWLQGGYVDATHIKTAILLDNDQTEILYYVGRGTAIWEKNEDAFDIIDYTASDVVDISLFSENFAQNSDGYLHAEISTDGCMITDVIANSCIDTDGSKMFGLYEDEREIWFCDKADVYWIFDILKSDGSYRCPMLVYDQTGAEETTTIRVSGRKDINDVFISGPDSVGVNELFTVEAIAGNDFIFFSPKFGRRENKVWTLSTGIPGSYNFYLYSDGVIAEKTVDVVEEKEFDLSVNVPTNITLGPLLVNITIRNLLDENKMATVKTEFNGNVYESMKAFTPGETKTMLLNITATEPGLKRLSASVMSDSISSYTTSIMVLKPETHGLLDAIIAFFNYIIEAIQGIFS